MIKIHSPLPYAQFAWSKLARFSKRKKYRRVFDIASSNFHNRHLFYTDRYIGGDISESKLREGIGKYPEDNSFGCVMNIADMPEVDHVADFIVCTYTLIFIPGGKRENIIDRLIRMTTPGGDIFLEMPKKTSPLLKIKERLQDDFEDVDIIYFNSPMSQVSQRGLAKRLNQASLFRDVIVLILTFLFEQMYPNISYGNGNVLFVGRNKKDHPGLNASKNINRITRLGNRLLQDRKCPLFTTISFDRDIKELNQMLIDHLIPDSYNNKSILFLSSNLDHLGDLDPLIRYLEERGIPWIQSSIHDKPKAHELVIYIDFKNRDTVYFHYHLYRLAKSEIILTFQKSKTEMVNRMF